MKSLKKKPVIATSQVETNTTEELEKVYEDAIPIKQIDPSKSNVREDYTGIEELAESIKKFGQLEPVGISEKTDKNGKYTLIYGFRRFKAIDSAKLKTIRVIKVPIVNSREEIQLIENIQRENLSDHELAKAISILEKKYNEKYPYPLLQQVLNKNKDWIYNKLTHAKRAEEFEKDGSLATSQVEALTTSFVKETSNLSPKTIKKIVDEAGPSAPIKKIRNAVRKHKEKVNDKLKKNKLTKLSQTNIDLKKILKELKGFLPSLKKAYKVAGKTEKAKIKKQIQDLLKSLK